jgi:arsenite-transporting ATPase
MNDLEVEAVDDVDASEDVVPEGVDAPRLVLYGGKGGVGKTTMAAATGLASARDGTPTLVVSTDPAHSLSDALGTDVPSRPGRLREDVPLYGVEIDPEAALEEDGVLGLDGDPLGVGGDGAASPAGGDGPMGDDAGPMGGLGAMMSGEGLGDTLGGDEIGDLFGGGAMPGADEAAAVRLLLQYIDDERFDRVVVDTAPTGHTLRLLELPEVLDSMVGRVMKLRRKVQGLVEGVKGLFGGDGAGQDRAAADLEALREQLEYLRDLLTDPASTDFRIVLVPEEMSVFESRRLRDSLRDFDVPVGTVVVNKVMEDLADVVEPRSTARRTESEGVAVDVDAEWFVAPDIDGCEFCQRRWQVQQRALGEAQELFMDTEIKRVPLFADEVRGEDMLRVVAACLD